MTRPDRHSAAAYDGAGNMTCRAPTSATTCNGTQTGAQLTYDSEGQLVGWQNALSSPTTTTKDLYDGEGNRVEQLVASPTTTTATTYIANLEELSTTSGITSTTTYYYAGGQRVAEAVNGTFSYLGSDGLGSAEVALDGSGNVQASTLYSPYGNTRYSTGTMPGSYGFTGQRADAATGLDYDVARYYDPVAGQFITPDSVQDGLNRYAYVAGNPETRTDPSGHNWFGSLLSTVSHVAHALAPAAVAHPRGLPPCSPAPYGVWVGLASPDVIIKRWALYCVPLGACGVPA